MQTCIFETGDKVHLDVNNQVYFGARVWTFPPGADMINDTKYRLFRTVDRSTEQHVGTCRSYPQRNEWYYDITIPLFVLVKIMHMMHFYRTNST